MLIFLFIVGGKKKQRKELIALKRRQRMINRGVDLDQIHYVSLIYTLCISLFKMLVDISIRGLKNKDFLIINQSFTLILLNIGKLLPYEPEGNFFPPAPARI